MLYKFGGIYLDLDFVTLNSLTHYENIVVSGQVALGNGAS